MRRSRSGGAGGASGNAGPEDGGAASSSRSVLEIFFFVARVERNPEKRKELQNLQAVCLFQQMLLGKRRFSRSSIFSLNLLSLRSPSTVQDNFPAIR